MSMPSWAFILEREADGQAPVIGVVVAALHTGLAYYMHDQHAPGHIREERGCVARDLAGRDAVEDGQSCIARKTVVTDACHRAQHEQTLPYRGAHARDAVVFQRQDRT